MKTKIFWIFLLSSVLLLTGCLKQKASDNVVGIANPASVYCEENWWTLELIFDNWESYGICHFENWKTCEEREFFRGECSSDEYTWLVDEININDFESCKEAWNPIKETYPATCFYNNNTFVQEIEDDKENNAYSWKDYKENILYSWENNIITTWNKDETIYCTMDAKQCPDWSYVSRSWPKCEFAPCPNIKDKANEISITDIFKEHKKKKSFNETWITEDDIDLIETIIEKLK